MKRSVCLLSVMFVMGSIASAQVVKYPDSVKPIFEDADALETLVKNVKPVIAVPTCSKTKALVKSVKESGGMPVVIPEIMDASGLEHASSGWDGALIPDDWVKEKDLYSILFYKTVADRNVPVMGSSPVAEEIDKGLMKMPNDVKSMDDLISKAVTYSHAKALMDRIFTIDTHSDLPDEYDNGGSIGIRSKNHTSIQKMDEGHLSGEVLISYLGQKKVKEMNDSVLSAASSFCFRQIDSIYADVARYKDFCGIARTSQDARNLRVEGKKALFIGVENAFQVGNDLDNIKKLSDKGVAYITLSHMYDNQVCAASTYSADTTKGLTAFGRKVVQEMNRDGIIIDCSHVSSGTFWDCIYLSQTPIICSHSGSKSVFKHDRNISDDQLRALAQTGGVIQVYIVPDYMVDDWSTISIDNMMDHLFHCIEVAGIDHVGIGCDFDGGGGGYGVNGENDAINITMRLLEHGLCDIDIEKLWSGNFFRVLDEVKAFSSYFRIGE